MIGEVKQLNLRMIRGDTKSFTIKITETNDLGEKETVPFNDGDTVYFTVRNDINQTTPDIAKEITSFTTDGTAILILEPNDTADLDVDIYQYDFQWSKGNGDVHTFLMGTLMIMAGVTRE